MGISFLAVDNLFFSYPESEKPVISALNLRFSRGWTAITGPNGSGKSTLLQLVCGILEPDSGSILPKTQDALYCPQQSDRLPEGWETAFNGMDGSAGKIFALLEIGDDWLFRFAVLSGGERKRLQLAAALCSRPPLLALDEPANHLDAHSRECIIRALEEYEGIGLLVSHDREFMDRLCNHTLFLTPGEALMYPGGAGKALELREADRKTRTAEWQKAESALKREKNILLRETEANSRSKNRLSAAHISPKDHDARGKIRRAVISGKDAAGTKAKSRADVQVSRAEEKLAAVDKPLYRKEGISVNAERSRRDYLCKIPAGELSAGEYYLSVPELIITPQSRIALTGDNGTGKTLLIRRIMEEFSDGEKDEGKIFYLPQEIDENAARTLLARFDHLDKPLKAEILSALYRLGSNPENIANREKKTLSPGELRKLMIAWALSNSLSLIIMDEPTNYMDISSIQTLENALRGCICSLLLVSHDRTFLRNLTDTHWHIERAGNRGQLEPLLARI